MREWLLGIVLTAFAGGLARQLAPRGREQAMVRLVSGLLLALALLAPLAELTGAAWEGEALEAAAFRQRTREQEALYRKNQQEVLAAIIAEKTEAYIWDKANRLGLACEVRVTTAAGESGIPGKVVGTIDMYDKYTFVEVPAEYAREIINSVNHTKIRGKSVAVEPANQK